MRTLQRVAEHWAPPPVRRVSWVGRLRTFAPGFVVGAAVATLTVRFGGPLGLGLTVGGAGLLGWVAGWLHRDMV